MRILALDIASNTGFALGLAGEMPRVGAKRLKKTTETGLEGLDIATDNMGAFIRDICFIEAERPDLIIYEASIPNFNKGDGRQREIKQSGISIATPLMLIGAMRGVARCYGIRMERVVAASWRKHFLGRANFGSRDETKRQTIRRCHLLNYLPVTDTDDNKADACGIFEYASAKYGRVQERDFALFDGGRIRHV